MVVPARRIPDATVARLPLYHRGLLELVRAKRPTVSSEEVRYWAEAVVENTSSSAVKIDFLFFISSSLMVCGQSMPGIIDCVPC